MPEVQTRVRFKNILFTTDFSEAADAALPYAASLARTYGAKIRALHVNPPAVNPMTPPVTWRAEEDAAKIRANEQKEKLRHAMRGMNPEILIEEGDLPSILDATIRSNDIDLIVMGTRGRSGVAKAVLGSAAEEIFRSVTCPVLTVGPSVPVTVEKPGEFSRILLATGTDFKHRAALPFALSLAQEFVADLTLVHVIERPKTCEIVKSDELEDATMRLLQGMVPANAQQWCNPSFAVKHGDPAEEILALAERKRADLIVLGVHKEHGFPGASTHLPISIAHKVVAQARCPVLTVRD